MSRRANSEEYHDQLLQTSCVAKASISLKAMLFSHSAANLYMKRAFGM